MTNTESIQLPLPAPQSLLLKFKRDHVCTFKGPTLDDTIPTQLEGIISEEDWGRCVSIITEALHLNDQWYRVIGFWLMMIGMTISSLFMNKGFFNSVVLTGSVIAMFGFFLYYYSVYRLTRKRDQQLKAALPRLVEIVPHLAFNYSSQMKMDSIDIFIMVAWIPINNNKNTNISLNIEEEGDSEMNNNDNNNRSGPSAPNLKKKNNDDDIDNFPPLLPSSSSSSSSSTKSSHGGNYAQIIELSESISDNEGGEL